MGIQEVLVVFILLQIKHLLIDWCWQPEYEWRNKGTYGHLGGLRHAGKNAAGTAACFLPFVPVPLAVFILLADFLLHYHIDWAKMNINRAMAWAANTHPQFWWLTGLDQALHQLCYVAWVAAAVAFA